MSSAGISADADESILGLAEAANTLRQQLIYNGEVLDLAFESLHGYREGTQSLSYLDASVNLAWAVIRGVEKSGKSEMYVRQRKTKKKKKAGLWCYSCDMRRVSLTDASYSITVDGDANGDGEEEEDEKSEEEVINETMFTFESFQLVSQITAFLRILLFIINNTQRFANSEVTRSLLAYLSRYKEFKSPECMKRVVNLLHRQAVKAKAEGLFFQVIGLFFPLRPRLSTYRFG
jgi:replication fork protection complex subunit Tof1/Swi1